MRDHRPTSTTELISESSLSKLQSHAQEITLLNQLLVNLLPHGTADHCRAANIRTGYLVLEVASAAIKMKIDYDKMNLLSQLRQQGFAKLMGIETKINPSLYRSKKEPEQKEILRRAPLSESAANSILATASIASPKIKACLERIADLAKKGDG
jgi:hypothetical protein